MTTSTEAEIGTWTLVTTLDDLWEGEMAPYTIGDTEVLVVNAAGTIAAFEDKCPHVANPLSTGLLDGDQLSCAAHNWTFDVGSGAGRNPATACLKRFALRIENESIYVNVEDVVQHAQKGM